MIEIMPSNQKMLRKRVYEFNEDLKSHLIKKWSKQAVLNYSKSNILYQEILILQVLNYSKSEQESGQIRKKGEW